MEKFWYGMLGVTIVVLSCLIAFIYSVELELKDSGGFTPSKAMQCKLECTGDLGFKYTEFIEEGWRDGRMECWCYDPENNRSLQIW